MGLADAGRATDGALTMAARPDPGRRGLLFGRRAAATPLRPPWALAEPAFLEACTACNACIDRCPERVLTHGAGRHPVFDPQLGECTFCGACASACPTAALDARRETWTLTALAGDACLPRLGVVCSSCRDACPEQAVRFPLLRAGVPLPVIDTDRCTGCGACVSVCPTRALALHRTEGEPA